MIRTMCVATVLVTVFLVGCSNEAPQHDFAFDLAGDGAAPLLPSVVPSFDEAILAQRSVTSGNRPAPAPAPEPAPDEAPAPVSDPTASALGAPAGGLSRPTLGGQLGGLGTGLTPLGQALTVGPASAEPVEDAPETNADNSDPSADEADVGPEGDQPQGG